MKNHQEMKPNLIKDVSLSRGIWHFNVMTTLTKNLFVAFVVCCLSILSSEAKAQNPSMVYKDWSLLGEDTAHIDISYRVVLCDMMSGPAIHLKLFNENPVLKETNFSITITNGATGATSATQHSIELAPAVIDAGECGVNSPYVIPVPTGYDPANISLTITF